MRFTLLLFIVTLVNLAAAAPQPADQGIGITIPLTKVSGFVNDGKSVSLHTLNSHVASLQAKIRRGFKLCEKYSTGTTHRHAMKRVGKRATGVALANHFIAGDGQLWYGTISVGTPAKPFTVLFDTGSSDFFLPASTCTNCVGHTLWDPTASSTSKNLDRKVSLEYINGATVNTHLYTDNVSLAGFTATSQIIGAATTYSERFRGPLFAADGMMGMGFQYLSEFDAIPIIETLVSQNQVTDAVFSFKFSSPGAELYIGGSNSTLYTGMFTYVPVTEEGRWQVTMDNVKSNDQPIFDNIPVLIDTGSSVIVGTSWQVYTLHDILGGTTAPDEFGEGYFTFPCDSFPTISFSFGGTTFPISPSSLNLGPIEFGSSVCVSGIVGVLYDSVWIIGNPFLQNVYTRFDLGNTQVGFAQLL